MKVRYMHPVPLRRFSLLTFFSREKKVSGGSGRGEAVAFAEEMGKVIFVGDSDLFSDFGYEGIG